MTNDERWGRGRNAALVPPGTGLGDVPVADLLAQRPYANCTVCRPGQLCPSHRADATVIDEEVGQTPDTPTFDPERLAAVVKAPTQAFATVY